MSTTVAFSVPGGGDAFFGFLGDLSKTLYAVTNEGFFKFYRAKEEQLIALAELVKHEVQSTIWNQQMLGPPLAEYAIRKKGHDVRLIETGEYAQSIGVKVWRPTPKSLIVQVAPEGERNQMLAAVHEHGAIAGSTTIPARPHWAPTLARIRNTPQFRSLVGKGVRVSLNF